MRVNLPDSLLGCLHFFLPALEALGETPETFLPPRLFFRIGSDAGYGLGQSAFPRSRVGLGPSDSRVHVFQNVRPGGRCAHFLESNGFHRNPYRGQKGQGSLATTPTGIHTKSTSSCIPRLRLETLGYVATIALL